MGVLILPSGKHSGERRTVIGVLVIPSAAAWEVELQNSAGTTVYHAKGAADTSNFDPVEFNADALNMSTATNIDEVLVYS